MSPTIPITKTLIGSDEVNSVDALYLHNELGVSKKFTDWIKAQIRRADLSEGKDYMVFASPKREAAQPQSVFPQKGKNLPKGSLTQKGARSKGGRPATQYILTLEAAKHIAMMSQSKKAREIRDYFIEVERRWIESLKSAALPAAQLAQLSERLDAVDRRTEAIERSIQSHFHASAQTQSQTQETLARVARSSERVARASDRLADAVLTMPLDGQQLSVIRDAVDRRGRELAEERGVTTATAIPAIYRELKRYFDVPSYHEIERADFAHCIQYIHTITL